MSKLAIQYVSPEDVRPYAGNAERAEWLDDFIGELLAFPGGRHDDQVDALVQGLAYQRGPWLRTYRVRPNTGY